MDSGWGIRPVPRENSRDRNQLGHDLTAEATTHLSKWASFRRGKFRKSKCVSFRRDDLHTSVALAAISETLKVMNDLLHTRKGKKQEKRLESLSSLEEKIRVVLSVLGLLPSSYHEALQQLREKALIRASITEELVLQKIEERTAARKAKQYEKSDEIRRELAAVGIALMDGPEETTWRPSLSLSEEGVVVKT
ncbi:cysteine--tRNA ligase CPS1 homolog, chloroplastic/mitochondrial-like [Phragmites australis]|uniref:cysteine--tRNA ligase CPS1 homolog, chloroplastic/mitochondrial-like n=1 Tax=Phragmites australis TaxID=29695 RepID=UPI002D79F764|nr:cysteine--tRNA ligase CPS1 homolog, chloroplastic/mitochondrial-like [Phragmites australis]